MPPIVFEIFTFLGFLVRALGFLIVGFALGRFTLEAFQKANWQLQVALALGFFALLAALTHFASPGSAGTFALGAGGAFLMAGMPRKSEESESRKK